VLAATFSICDIKAMAGAAGAVAANNFCSDIIIRPPARVAGRNSSMFTFSRHFVAVESVLFCLTPEDFGRQIVVKGRKVIQHFLQGPVVNLCAGEPAVLIYVLVVQVTPYLEIAFIVLRDNIPKFRKRVGEH